MIWGPAFGVDEQLSHYIKKRMWPYLYTLGSTVLGEEIPRRGVEKGTAVVCFDVKKAHSFKEILHIFT